MSDAECVGRGAGWGTIAGRRLRILVLVGSGDRSDAERIRAAIARAHDVELVAVDGFKGALLGAQAARELHADLIHAVGVEGVAKSAETIAAGSSLPLIASLRLRDLEERARPTKRRAERARAVIVPSGEAAERLRARGVERDIYVLALPSGPNDEPAYLGALEVVYGRVLGAEDAGEGAEGGEAVAAAPQLVQLRSRKNPE